MTTINITSAEELLATIPAVLGFHPQESVVLVTFLRGSARMGPIIRTDLAEYNRDLESLAEYLAATTLRHADRCIVVFYTAEEPDAIAQYDAEYFHTLLEVGGLTVLGPPSFQGNAPREPHPAVHAENVGLGRVIFDRREDLARLVEHSPVYELVKPPELIRFMSASGTRDDWLAAHLGDPDKALAEVLVGCRQCDDHHRATTNLCTVAAILAYRTGDGALAWTCVDRALRINRMHPLARLMRVVIENALPPKDLDQLVPTMQVLSGEESSV